MKSKEKGIKNTAELSQERKEFLERPPSWYLLCGASSSTRCVNNIRNHKEQTGANHGKTY